MELIKEYKGYSIYYVESSHILNKIMMFVFDKKLNLLFIAPTDKSQFHQVQACEQFIEERTK